MPKTKPAPTTSQADEESVQGDLMLYNYESREWEH